MIYIISNFLSLFILYYIGIKTNSKKFKHYVNFIIIISLSFFLAFVNIKISISIFNSLLVMFCHFIFYLICFKANHFIKIFNVLSFIVFQVISEAFVTNIISMFSHNSIILDNNHLLLTAILSSAVCCFFLSFLFVNFTRNYKQIISSKFSILIFILPITTIILLLNLSNYFEFNPILLFIYFGLIISNFITIYVYIKNLEYIKKENEKKLIEIENKSLRTKYELLNSQFNANFNFIHDLINKLSQSEEQIKNKEYDLIESSIKEINRSLTKEFNIIYTNSRTIGFVLNSRLETLINNNIEVKTSIQFNDFTFIDDLNQIDIYEKSLDFAIESCLNSNQKEKIIVLDTFEKNNLLFIKILFNKKHSIDEIKLNSNLKQISHTVALYHGKISFLRDFSSELSSLVIMFDINEINNFYTEENKIKQ